MFSFIPGIDLYDGDGAKVSEGGGRTIKITANPSDINVLPGYCKSPLLLRCVSFVYADARYKNDPRTVDKLLDGVNRTCDDLHMWLAPFTRYYKTMSFNSEPQTTNVFAVAVIISFTLTSAILQHSA
jgi:hypothetical protein